MKINNIDIFDYIKYLKENRLDIEFDAIITDPPYNISRKNNFTTMGRTGIAFGEGDYDFNQVEGIKQVIPFLKVGENFI